MSSEGLKSECQIKSGALLKCSYRFNPDQVVESFSKGLFSVNITERKLTYIILIIAQILNGVGSQALLI